ncbi:MAG: hypothetical protein MK441_07990, partial [SAR324 cluster bacterium]|nr:hypothetical protein [SAR324 cluster bacterium]
KVQLSGRAWSGQGRLEKVEIGIDGIWKEASLGKELGKYAWRQWFLNGTLNLENTSFGHVHLTKMEITSRMNLNGMNRDSGTTCSTQFGFMLMMVNFR